MSGELYSLGVEKPSFGGDVSIVSFYATKLMPAGEGGACITCNPELAEAMRELRDCDEQLPRMKAFNFKLSDLHATLALGQLDRLDANVAARARMAEVYDHHFGEHAFSCQSSQERAVAYRYVIAARDEAETFIQRAAKAGVQCRRPIWQPLHYTIGGMCRQAERLHDKLVSLPFYVGLGEGEMGQVVRRSLPLL